MLAIHARLPVAGRRSRPRTAGEGAPTRTIKKGWGGDCVVLGCGAVFSMEKEGH